MPSTYELLEARLQSAFDALKLGSDPVLRPSDRSDYQVNGVMGLAKALGRPPLSSRASNSTMNRRHIFLICLFVV